jgi:hypothetical protein
MSHSTLAPHRWSPTAIAALCVLLAALMAACGSPTSSVRPSASLVELEFTLRPSGDPTESDEPSGTPEPTPGSWPVGWDVAFCTALTDLTVAHELVIDIERAIGEDARDDARGLTAELAEVAPIAAAEIERLRDWEPALELKTSLTELVELELAVAAAYQTWFDEGGRPLLRDARRARNQVGRAVPQVNEQLGALADLGLSCPGTTLELEEF